MTVLDAGAGGPPAGGSAAASCGCPAKASRRHRDERWLGLAEEVPEFQRRDYVLKHYRLEYPRLRHFWRLHNEWVNMWTHILAGTYFLHHIHCWVAEQEPLGNPWSLAWPRPLYFFGVATFFVTSLAMFGISVQYHWRMCTPEREFFCWLCLDQSACLALVAVGYLAGIPMGFHCYPDLREMYGYVAVVACLSTATALTLLPKTYTTFRSAVVLMGASVAIVPTVHWLTISTAGRRATGASLCLAMACASVAAFVLFSMFPECCAPGRFDLFGSSHQIWHVLIFVTIVKYSDCLTSVFALTATPEYCAP